MTQNYPYLPIFSMHESKLLQEQGEVRVQPLGLVFVHKTEGMGVFRDVLARIKDFFGGNVGTYNNSVHTDLIIPALRELSDLAHHIYGSELHGAPDAILGFVMNVQPLSSKGMSMMQVTMFGTVVKFHPVASSGASSSSVPETVAA